MNTQIANVPWRFNVVTPGYTAAPAPQATVAEPFDPAAKSIQGVLTPLSVDPKKGLSAAEADRRLQQHGKNEIAHAEKTSALARFAGQFKNPLSLLLLPAGVIAAVMGEVPDAIGIGVVSLLNAGIGYVQEARAEKSMDALNSLSVREARVLRDGHRQTVPASNLVPGDIIHLSPGDVVPADARLIESQSLTTDEAALTGESLPVNKDANATVAPKSAPHAQKNMIFSGTGVKNGGAEAVVTSTGLNTQIGDIAKKTQTATPPPTPLERDLHKVASQFIKMGGVASVGVGVAAAMSMGSPMAGLSTAISTLVAVVPESLPTVTTLTLTNGIREARERNVLIRNLSSVETLGSTTVICTDKTGTLTTGEMEGRKIWALTPEDEKLATLGALIGNTAEREGGRWLGAPTEIAMMTYVNNLPGLKFTMESDGVTATFKDGHAQKFTLTPEQRAAMEPLVTEGKKSEALDALSDAIQSRSKDYPFSSVRKMHTVAVPGEILGGTGYLSFTSGALDRILPQTNMTDAEKAAVIQKNDELAAQGFRVIALATRKSDALGATEDMESGLTLSGLMAIQDPLRDGVKNSVAELHGAGIRVMVITGDQILTAKSIATEAGILTPGKNQFVLSDDLLENVDPSTAQGKARIEEIVKQAEAAEEVVVSGPWIDVFADRPQAEKDPKNLGVISYDRFKALAHKACVAYRVEPRHKFRLVQTLQELGETVAMTGDGVNDAPAIKAADIGIAMGIRGTEVTKEAAHMILTDDSFNSIASGVKVGRLIHSNIRKNVAFTVSSNLAEIAAVGMTSVAGIATGAGLPPIFTPLQILWINLATDTMPSLGLGQETAESELMKEQPRGRDAGLISKRKLGQLLTLGGVMGATAAGLYMLGPVAGNVAQTMAFNYLNLAQLVNALNARKEGNGSPFEGLLQNKLLLGSIVGTAALQVALPFIPGVGSALKVATLTLPQWAIVGGLAAAVLPAGMLVKKIFKEKPEGGH
ncbi:MAG: cation-transporting P-type ATPase [Armatimonadetes bacterium]|nr:cation-transporting P-type ATPase [Armatimonadota bacterium]